MPIVAPPPPPPPKEIRQLKSSLRGTRQTASSPQDNLGIPSQDSSDLFSNTESSLTSQSERSKLRDMRPMVDSDGTLGNSTISTVPSAKQLQPKISTAASAESMESKLMKTINDVANMFDDGHDGDNNTQMTWGSANEMIRPKGQVKFLSAVPFLGQNVGQEDELINAEQFIDESNSNGSGSGIVDMLDDFDKQMNTNIKSPSEENDENSVLADFNKTLVPNNLDMESNAPEPGHFLTPLEAKKLQILLYKSRNQVAILTDNIEQYRYEIEQMEEEHYSELNLVEDRAKNKFEELKQMYESEIDSLLKEKDDAVIEATRVAAGLTKHEAEQLSELQDEINHLKATAASTIAEKIEEERQVLAKSAEKEIEERIASMQKSHEKELEQLSKEYDELMELEIQKAVSFEALNHDAEISDLTTQIEELCRERCSTIELLESVKNKFEKHYPDDIVEFKERGCHERRSSLNLLDSNDATGLVEEKILKQVIEMFTFLLESTEKKVADEVSKFDESKVGIQKSLVHHQRSEIAQLRREKIEKNEKLRKLEEDFKVLSREKILLEEKYETDCRSHKLNLERLTAEKKTVMNIERSRKDLEHAMAAGQRELAQQQVMKKSVLLGTRAIPQRNDLKIQSTHSTNKDDPVDCDLGFRCARSVPSPKAQFPIRSPRTLSVTNEKNEMVSPIDTNMPCSTATPKTFESTETASMRRARSFRRNYASHASKFSPSTIANHVTNDLKSEPPARTSRATPTSDNNMLLGRSTSAFTPVSRKNVDIFKLPSSPSVESKDSDQRSTLIVDVDVEKTKSVEKMNTTSVQSESSNEEPVQKDETPLLHVMVPKKIEKTKPLESKGKREAGEEERGCNEDTNVSGEKTLKIVATEATDLSRNTKLAASILRSFNKTKIESNQPTSSRLVNKTIEGTKQNPDLVHQPRRFANDPGTYREDEVSTRSRRLIEFSSFSRMKVAASSESKNDNQKHGKQLGENKTQPPIIATSGGDKKKEVESTVDLRVSKIGTNTDDDLGHQNMEKNDLVFHVESQDEIQIPPPPQPLQVEGSDEQRDEIETTEVAEGDPFRECSTDINLKHSPSHGSMKSLLSSGKKGKKASSRGSKLFAGFKTRVRVRKVDK